MKTSTISLILILQVIFAAASAAPNAVLDINGKKLRSETQYYILPVFRGMGGGLTLGFTGRVNNSEVDFCPLDVVQKGNELETGLPLTFSPVNPKKDVIRESTDLNIQFEASTICIQSTLWKLTGRDEATGLNFVGTGGEKGNPGKDTVSNWFKIEKYDNDYKLVFCPSVCDICKVICMDVGIYVDENHMRRLVLSEKPFKVMFRKVD
ncbi:miraculin-like [Impatiens glandulifera]|uniref:miraculin-like n=1 Tax=Impatiens glandulifera TaxID=253017 RepID=UPI001FB1109F|nr:miraculin-like [Impatiens glandulifera]